MNNRDASVSETAAEVVQDAEFTLPTQGSNCRGSCFEEACILFL